MDEVCIYPPWLQSSATTKQRWLEHRHANLQSVSPSHLLPGRHPIHLPSMRFSTSTTIQAPSTTGLQAWPSPDAPSHINSTPTVPRATNTLHAPLTPAKPWPPGSRCRLPSSSPSTFSSPTSPRPPATASHRSIGLARCRATSWRCRRSRTYRRWRGPSARGMRWSSASAPTSSAACSTWRWARRPSSPAARCWRVSSTSRPPCACAPPSRAMFWGSSSTSPSASACSSTTAARRSPKASSAIRKDLWVVRRRHLQHNTGHGGGESEVKHVINVSCSYNNMAQ